MKSGVTRAKDVLLINYHWITRGVKDEAHWVRRSFIRVYHFVGVDDESWLVRRKLFLKWEDESSASSRNVKVQPEIPEVPQLLLPRYVHQSQWFAFHDQLSLKQIKLLIEVWKHQIFFGNHLKYQATYKSKLTTRYSLQIETSGVHPSLLGSLHTFRYLSVNN